ncbi:hypothetical protein HYV56_00880 [Candidatus Peregrinibacteria bacterium]|nr:hypothetical protein [Candidatus Peregrinibacteria bacterium]
MGLLENAGKWINRQVLEGIEGVQARYLRSDDTKAQKKAWEDWKEGKTPDLEMDGTVITESQEGEEKLQRGSFTFTDLGRHFYNNEKEGDRINYDGSSDSLIIGILSPKPLHEIIDPKYNPKTLLLTRKGSYEEKLVTQKIHEGPYVKENSDEIVTVLAGDEIQAPTREDLSEYYRNKQEGIRNKAREELQLIAHELYPKAKPGTMVNVKGKYITLKDERSETA